MTENEKNLLNQIAGLKDEITMLEYELARLKVEKMSFNTMLQSELKKQRFLIAEKADVKQEVLPDETVVWVVDKDSIYNNPLILMK